MTSARLRQHGPAAAGFVALAVVWSFPLVLHLSTHLPGPGIGDNMLSLWNFWWMRTALASGTNFFFSPYQFAPVGVDLTLYTHTALPAFVGATLLSGLSVVTALNVTVLVALALNGFFAYLLAWHVVRDRGAAILAGAIYGSSPYISAHLNGHFDLTGAWTIPLFAFTTWEARRGSIAWAAVSGVVLGLTAYVAYYYVVYELVIAACVVAFEACDWSLSVEARRPVPRALSMFLAVAIALDILVIAAIMATGGFNAQLGPIRLSMRDTFNPRQLFWLLAAVAVWMRFRPRVRARARRTWPPTTAAYALGAIAAGFVVVTAPLIWGGVKLLLGGQYVTQIYFWRNAPIGIDVATLVLGSPFHGIWGAPIRNLYARMGVDLIESGAWLGIAPVVLALYALRRRWSDRAVREWAAIATVFFVWALGSHVYAAGRNTGLIMPAALVRYVPIVSNARMPGRTIVVVYLAIAVLSAVVVADWRSRWRRPALATVALLALVTADFLAVPFPLTPMECPRIYQAVRGRPELGSLAELPLGLGDGLGALTPVDMRVLLCQTIHERPLVGGITSRLPPNVLASYEADPLISGWLRLSGLRPGVMESQPLPGREAAGERLIADHIAFVMLNRRSASPELRHYVEHVLPLTLIVEDDDRALYVTSSRGSR